VEGPFYKSGVAQNATHLRDASGWGMAGEELRGNK